MKIIHAGTLPEDRHPVLQCHRCHTVVQCESPSEYEKTNVGTWWCGVNYQYILGCPLCKRTQEASIYDGPDYG